MTAGAQATSHRDLIIALAARHRLPAVYYGRYWAAAGGLISYGSDLLDPFRRAGMALREHKIKLADVRYCGRYLG